MQKEISNVVGCEGNILCHTSFYKNMTLLKKAEMSSGWIYNFSRKRHQRLPAFQNLTSYCQKNGLITVKMLKGNISMFFFFNNVTQIRIIFILHRCGKKLKGLKTNRKYNNSLAAVQILQRHNFPINLPACPKLSLIYIFGRFGEEVVMISV